MEQKTPQTAKQPKQRTFAGAQALLKDRRHKALDAAVLAYRDQSDKNFDAFRRAVSSYATTLIWVQTCWKDGQPLPVVPSKIHHAKFTIEPDGVICHVFRKLDGALPVVYSTVKCPTRREAELLASQWCQEHDIKFFVGMRLMEGERDYAEDRQQMEELGAAFTTALKDLVLAGRMANVDLNLHLITCYQASEKYFGLKWIVEMSWNDRGEWIGRKKKKPKLAS
jgi:hypothetical protein